MCVRRPSSERGRSAYRAAVPSRSSARPSASDSPAYSEDRESALPTQSGFSRRRWISLLRHRRSPLSRLLRPLRRAPRPRVATTPAAAASALVLHAPSSLGALSSFVKALRLLRVAGLHRVRGVNAYRRLRKENTARPRAKCCCPYGASAGRRRQGSRAFRK